MRDKCDENPKEGNFMRVEVHHINVNAGDSTLIIILEGETPIKAALIDAGTAQYSKRVLDHIAIFKEKSLINKIDTIIITHFDADHFAGLISLLQKGELDNYINFKELKIIMPDNKINGETSPNNKLYKSFIAVLEKKSLDINKILFHISNDKSDGFFGIDLLWINLEYLQKIGVSVLTNTSTRTNPNNSS